MDVLTQKITRKEFLIKAGLLILALTGVSGLFKKVSSPFSPKQTGGYGGSKYGK